MWNKLLQFTSLTKLPAVKMPAKMPVFKMPSLKRQPAGQSAGTDYIDDKYFTITIGAAIALHIVGVYLWHLAPKTEVVDIPVHALSIKLGDGDPMTPEEQKLIEQNSQNKNDVESAINKIAHDQDPATQARTQSVVSSMDKIMEKDKPADKERDNTAKALDKAIASPNADALTATQDSAQKLATIAKQFVRTNNVQAPSAKGAGNALGNSTTKDAELMSRYEQLISMWIEKFKQYPDEARTQGIQGETVVRIRIDRKGNVRYYILERSTGYQVLDRAAIDMVKRANPVPAVPNDYPQGDLIEFLIPVNFKLQ